MLTITPIYAGLAAILFASLSFRVSVLRFRYRVSAGDGGEKSLAKAIRLQGNTSEYLPLGLLLLTMLELTGGASWLVHLFGVMLVGGRILFLIGFGPKKQILLLRQTGILMTYGMIAFSGAYLLITSLI
ncbi:MAG: MAPEG family protein [Maritimibacter sp.]